MRIIYILFGFIVFFTACRPNPIGKLSDEDSQLFITSFDNNVNFSEYSTFAPTEEFFYINRNKISISTKEGDLYFKDLATKTLIKRGFILKKIDEKPDLGLHVMIVNNSKIGNGSLTSTFFNNYWGFGNFGLFGFEYPGIYDSYESRDIIWNVELIDLKNAEKNKKLKVIWNAQIQGNGIFNPEKLSYFVEKIFSKSQYLKTTNGK